MKDKIRDLLCRYTDNNMYADYDFLQELLNILIKRYGTNSVKGVIIISDNQKGISDFENSLIGINLKYINNELIKNCWYRDAKLNLYLFNISVILVFIHEFNHFRQVAKYKNLLHSEEFLDKLFVNSFVMMCSSNVDLVNIHNNTNYTDSVQMDNFYNEYHDCLAVERSAQIDAYRLIIEIIAPIQQKLDQVYYRFLYEYYSYKLNEYFLIDDVIISPIDKMLIYMEDCFTFQDASINTVDDEENIDDFYNDIIAEYNLIDRFRYGLPITREEYNDAIDFMNVMYILSDNFSDPSKIKKRYKK